MLDIKKEKLSKQSILNESEAIKKKEELEKANELKSIVSIDKIEQDRSGKNKPAKPVDARKVGYDIFIGKKK